MSQYGNAAAAAKNPPWVRSGQNITMGVGQTGQLPPSLMANAIPPMANASMLQYPQQQVFQGQVGIQQASLNMGGMAGIPTASVAPIQASLGASQMYGAVGAVTYPTRALNTSAFQGSSGGSSSGAGVSGASSSGNQPNGKQPHRVFTGTITKIQDNFGFVDEDVFFQTSCCVKGSSPQVGDRVLVEASYNANMPFKWNATRIQVLPVNRDNSMQARIYGSLPSGAGYNAVPPPGESSQGGNMNRSRFMSGDGSRFSGGGGGGGGGDRGGGGRDRGPRGGGGGPRPRDSMREEMDLDSRKRRRDDRDNHRGRGSSREREREDKEKERVKSPPRKRSKSPSRARRQRRPPAPRYSVQVPNISLDSSKADVLHIRKRYSNLYVPSDFFSANLSWTETFPLDEPMSLNFPCSFHIMHRDVEPITPIEAVLEPPDVDYLYSAKVMLLSSPGLEEMYSKCISLTEERREGEGGGGGGGGGGHSSDDESSGGGALFQPSRLILFLVGLRGKSETMAIGGPWSPSLDGPNPESDPGVLIKTATRNCLALTGIDLSACTQWFRFVEILYNRPETVHKGKTQPERVERVVVFVPDVWSCLQTRLEWDQLQLAYKKSLSRRLNKDESADEKEEEVMETIIPKREPKHHSELDPKNMKVNELREELEARSMSPKGLKSQLVARLQKVIRTEATDEAAASKKAPSPPPKGDKKDDDDKNKKKEEDEKKKITGLDKSLLEKRYKLPDSPHIIVHPNRAAKSGKFDCQLMSLSTLLDYRQDDTKEHSFEVSLFAELFNEMLMRDFGFNIFCSIAKQPEKPKEEKDHKKDKKDSKEDNKDRKDDDIDEDEDPDEDEEDKERKDRPQEESKRRKLYTADPHLLLSFSYFDKTRTGYVFDKDLEELFYCLGLMISRAQVKKMLQKVVFRDSLYYRRLTDRNRDDPVPNDTKVTQEDKHRLAQGNKCLAPSAFSETAFKNMKNETDGGDSEMQSGYVMYKGSLVDVGKLMDQLAKSETARIEVEKALTKIRQEHSKTKENLQKFEKTNKDLVSDLKDVKERLSNANTELCNMDEKARRYTSVLNEIHEKVKPFVGGSGPKAEVGGAQQQSSSSDVEIVEVKTDSSASPSPEKRAPPRPGPPSPSPQAKDVKPID